MLWESNFVQILEALVDDKSIGKNNKGSVASFGWAVLFMWWRKWIQTLRKRHFQTCECNKQSLKSALSSLINHHNRKAGLHNATPNTVAAFIPSKQTRGGSKISAPVRKFRNTTCNGDIWYMETTTEIRIFKVLKRKMVGPLNPQHSSNIPSKPLEVDMIKLIWC